MQSSIESRDSVVLLGMMGCGKSSIGKKLAQKLDLPFHDSDETIEEQLQTSIADIFDKHGEEYFRFRELEVIKQLADKPSWVAALGGGAYDQEEVRLSLSEMNHTTTVYLCVPPEILWTRVKHDPKRPLAQDSYEEFWNLLNSRTSSYENADITIDCGSDPQSAITRKIISALQTA